MALLKSAMCVQCIAHEIIRHSCNCQLSAHAGVNRVLVSCAIMHATVRFSCMNSVIMCDLNVQSCVSEWGILSELDAHV